MYRICVGCEHPIIRNIAFLDGEAWHYGELRAKERFGGIVAVCQTCLNHLTNSKVTHIKYGDDMVVRSCGICGSQHLRFLKDPTKLEIESQ
jgi:hypothetical protein